VIQFFLETTVLGEKHLIGHKGNLDINICIFTYLKTGLSMQGFRGTACVKENGKEVKTV
jgi:hypothetical protein